MKFPEELRAGLIVSCQAAHGDPLDDTAALTRIADCALRGGAHGLRAEGSDHVRSFRTLTRQPIIGIKKRYSNGEVFITSKFEDAATLAEAGASIIAVDCTERPAGIREPWREIVRRIREELRLPVMADISTYDEAMRAIDSGADAVATTLAGYTPDSAGLVGAAWELLDRLVARSHVPVVLEGRVETPADLRRGLDSGAFAVVVGAAITQPQALTARFAAAAREL